MVHTATARELRFVLTALPGNPLVERRGQQRVCYVDRVHTRGKLEPGRAFYVQLAKHLVAMAEPIVHRALRAAIKTPREAPNAFGVQRVIFKDPVCLVQLRVQHVALACTQRRLEPPSARRALLARIRHRLRVRHV